VREQRSTVGARLDQHAVSGAVREQDQQRMYVRQPVARRRQREVEMLPGRLLPWALRARRGPGDSAVQARRGRRRGDQRPVRPRTTRPLDLTAQDRDLMTQQQDPAVFAASSRTSTATC
jgi:hypothetical protein